MGIFSRMSDIISANINYLLDKAEDPEKMIKQVIAEMHEKIQEARNATAQTIAAEKRLQKEVETNQQQVEEWHQKALQAVQSGNDDLARKALGRKKEHDHIVAGLQPQQEAAHAASENLKVQLQALQAKLAEAKRKQSALIARQRAAEAQSGIQKTLSKIEIDDAAFQKFDRMEEKVEEMEAQAQALTELGAEDAALDEEIRQIEDKDVIEQELAGLKAEADQQRKENGE